jgi:NAD(P)-dependent dehydrogenase (short-subunit alcohol dehydrogenase family)
LALRLQSVQQQMAQILQLPLKQLSLTRVWQVRFIQQAEEIEAAGGKALPLIVDVRFEDQVQEAMDKTAAEFGGIDILINNASAINLAGTESVSMKGYDLMHNINTRGTFLCSQKAVPYLRKSG